MRHAQESIGVIGAGSWGTTLAHLLAEKGFAISLWVFEKELCETIQKTRENTLYLPGFSLSERIMPSSDIQKVAGNRRLLVMVVPSHVYRSVALQVVPHLQENVVIVSATKGIENQTLLTMSGIWKEILPKSLGVRVVTLAGPSFAREVMQRTPTAVTVAADDLETAHAVQQVFHTPYFRVYTSPDKVGVELAGALKNVIAIAAGVCDGLGYGLNTRAALISRGLAEITRLGVRLGAHPLTFAGLSGIGDLLLTCTGDLSRNRTVGFRLGRGETLQQILADMTMVAEGVRTCTSVYELAKKVNVDMPICEQMYKILHENKDPRQAVWDLMDRDLKSELEFPLP